jgi:hypothetical protein
VLLVALVPIGALVGVEQASGNPTLAVTSIAVAPATAGTQPYGGETDLNTTWDTTIIGQAAGSYPEGTVTVVAINTVTTAVTDLCASDWDGSTGFANTGGAEAPDATLFGYPTPTAPYDEADYYCSGPTNNTTLAPGTYDIESQLTGAIGDAVNVNYSNADSASTTYIVTKATTTLTTNTVPVSSTASPWADTDVVAGAPITENAVLSGGVSPTGTINFAYYAGACPASGTIPIYATDTVTANGTYQATFTPTVTGDYCLYASYSGDANNSSPSGGAGFYIPADGEGTFVVSAATPTINTAATASTLGNPISDTVNLVGVSGNNASGLVTISAEEGSCPGGTGVFTYTANLSTIATYSTTAGVTTATVVVSFTPTAVGTYYWTVSYAGDTNNAPVAEGCHGSGGTPVTPESSVVSKASTTTITQVVDESTGTAPSGSQPAGTAFHDTAVVTGGTGANTPSGTVTYTYFTNGTCTPTGTTQNVTLAGGVVPNSASTGPLGPGNYSYDAVYNGDSNNAPSATSSCEPFSVGLAATTTDTQVIVNATGAPPTGSELAGSAFHDTATVTTTGSFTPTGTVTYTLYTARTNCTGANSTQSVTLVGGSVPNSASSGPLAAGSYSYDAKYNGDSNNAASGVSTCEPFTVGAVSPVVITPATLPDAIVGDAYSTTIGATGGVPPYQNWTVTSGSLPPGLGPIGSSTGVISGTPSAGDSGTYTFTLTVQDSRLPTPQTSAPVTFTITVGGPLTITAPSRLPGGNHGRMYMATVTTSGGIGALHFAITGGKLPPGLGINVNTGVITGPAGAIGTYSFVVTVTDSGTPQQSVSKTFTITIS